MGDSGAQAAPPPQVPLSLLGPCSTLAEAWHRANSQPVCFAHCRADGALLPEWPGAHTCNEALACSSAVSSQTMLPEGWEGAFHVGVPRRGHSVGRGARGKPSLSPLSNRSSVPLSALSPTTLSAASGGSGGLGQVQVQTRLWR